MLGYKVKSRCLNVREQAERESGDKDLQPLADVSLELHPASYVVPAFALPSL
jgi:hypothetical protein